MSLLIIIFCFSAEIAHYTNYCIVYTVCIQFALVARPTKFNMFVYVLKIILNEETRLFVLFKRRCFIYHLCNKCFKKELNFLLL